MTKRVRIENADNSHYRIVVDVFDRNHTVGPDFLVETHEINNPTDLVELYVHSERYLVVREKRSDE